ncbi:MAG: DsbA family protein [Mariprofundus sp.]|nr:DsbA family protein [Mariprofundus sp.]
MFNFDFWTQCQPRRSTYPSCRAVIAARKQGMQHEQGIIDAIQTAYYLEARNPSDNNTLIDLAMQLHLQHDQFRSDFYAPETQTTLLQEIRQVQQMQAYGLPSLILHKNGSNHRITIDYNHAKPMLEQINSLV